MTHRVSKLSKCLKVVLLFVLMCPVRFAVAQQSGQRTLSGTVYDDERLPLIGAVIKVEGSKTVTGTKADGTYSIKVPVDKDVVLLVSFVGLQTSRVVIPKGTTDVKKDISLQGDTKLKEVIVTGIYTRPMGSYTGSATTIKGDEIRKVGGQNLLQSLKNVDPSIYLPDNLSLGSDPNNVPDLSLRGNAAVISEGTGNLRSTRFNPNQPLFIVDGFETSIEAIMDMDMNRIESLTVLKDASAKALYGSKAANGVIVIETRKLQGNQQRVTYAGSVNFELPDLTSYDLTNAREKLEVELLNGVYSAPTQDREHELKLLYQSRLAKVVGGLDTYWLSKPLRAGVGHKHNLSIELGDAQGLKGIVDFSYNDIQGAMKGSSRVNVSTSANLSYRKDNLIFRNILTINSNKATDSPYGSFDEYARMNPYWEAVDRNGEIKRWAEDNIPNPMYNATIGTSSVNEYISVTNNIYAEWHILPQLKSTLRLGVAERRGEGNTFLPPMHSIFASQKDVDKRGRYILDNGRESNYTADLNVNYNTNFGKHAFFVNGGAFIGSRSSSNYRHVAEGFSNNQLADATFAKGYAQNSKPQGFQSLVHDLSFLLATSYDYDSRYLIDLTLRESASSLYGANSRWASSWSAGLGWNIHNEAFLKGNKWLQMLKVRASVGLTGNQNFLANYSVPTYLFYNDRSYMGLTGAYLKNMPNPDLKWEQRMDYNVGLDTRVGPMSVSLDLYQSDTRNMLTDLTIPGSTGFSIVKDNLGMVRNSGIEGKMTYRVWGDDKGNYLNLFGSVIHNRNKIVSLSQSLKDYNERMKQEASRNERQAPVLIYEDGESLTTLWAVKSAGIDPSNGREIYVKRDGSLTYDYSASDLVASGNTEPKIRGNFGFSGEYRNFGINLYFNYQMGAMMYNSTLVGKVENAEVEYNVDRRILQGRWKKPGDMTPFKRFDVANRTRVTTRFVQRRDELHISALSLYYEVPKKWASRLRSERLRLAFNMNDLATFSTIYVERGTAYPFARKFSFSLTSTF